MQFSNLFTSLRWLVDYSPLKATIGMLAMAGITACSSPSSKASDDLFHSAQRNMGNEVMLDQYASAMSNSGSVLAYYPEYWKLNQNLAWQHPNNIIAFAQRYPQSAMAEKLAADYVEEKVTRAG